jgi:hypothetical protein
MDLAREQIAEVDEPIMGQTREERAEMYDWDHGYDLEAPFNAPQTHID